ncbi:DUF3750 domain-containing protein [Pseudidiomarina terrestris]|uniref:DUF3750 domain-containing protein n=1 Tax=Pseudidiomarina terrestris TaxID=2820060 RepID=A0AAW7R0G1_9GAMM|nr:MULTISPECIES: DUF3750 domain-containing protein [unclassified Pseudidiomarina]MDN7125181.1 DUF3750 domain-containing protein [Pseudidiomarina sp. 1APP75-32.1]MDN7127416.1 DUF3750 domain-containing protein [Pseudidiomarina sp. 1APR75-33.1]MDN7129942.1 DUF3750 domain-containing protein [Pseudidiomarina sp. 1APR75-15]MDN7136108.1 DUF3750 domain-containing protein [Pseudidiomarina sp. 1ASP75-5]MDN7138367.1 DUF3750 domain-containing protein [Pseudidiomarina sp. 1ASP75-14]
MKKSVVILTLLLVISACSSSDWRDASRESAGLAADPQLQNQAIIEAYAADAFGWRGWFAVHTWLAVKPENATEYTVYEVVGWRVDNGEPALRVYQTKTPDRYWYGARPEKLLSLTGIEAAELIPQIAEASTRYPWANEYRAVPGPNSNTFPAWIALQFPQLGLKLPFSAIGSGYADNE